jgi:hypothetical protein
MNMEPWTPNWTFQGPAMTDRPGVTRAYETFEALTDAGPALLAIRTAAKSSDLVTSLVRFPKRMDALGGVDVASWTTMKFGPVLPVEARATV